MNPISLNNSGIAGQALLPNELAGFFAERSYLAQSTLGRLLDEYAPRGSGSESSLVRFVKELVGIDGFDALIDGLNDAADIRNTRRLIPSWSQMESLQATGQSQLTDMRGQLATIDAAISATHADLLAVLSLEAGATSVELLEAASVVSSKSESLSARRSSVLQLTDEVRAVEMSLSALDRADVELRPETVAEAEMVLDAQWDSLSSELGAALKSALGNDIEASATSAASDWSRAMSVVQARQERNQEVLNRQGSVVQTLREVERRGAEVDQVIAALRRDRSAIAPAVEGAALVDVLTTALSALSDDVCPVCDQDFAEGSLRRHVTDKLARTTVAAEQLVGIQSRLDSAMAQAQATYRQRDELEAQRLEPGDVEGVVLQMRSNEVMISTLGRLEGRVAQVGFAAQRLFIAREAEATITQSRAVVVAARRRLAAVALNLGYELVEGDLNSGVQGIVDSLARSLESITAEMERASIVQAKTDSLVAIQLERRELQARIGQSEKAAEAVGGALDEANSRKRSAMDLRNQAMRQRSQLLGSVFDERLNRTWRILFQRLIPTEPFVPRFRKQDDNTRNLKIALETTDRQGHAAGSPAAMLSYGNLNTAALSLFMALHFVAKPRLPWLLLDDPVQSMDEVHIANFAATLKEVTRRHDRQVVIAVHQKELFDYLALELSPAVPDDRLNLITVRKNGGKSQIESRSLVHDPKFAVGPRAVA